MAFMPGAPHTHGMHGTSQSPDTPLASITQEILDRYADDPAAEDWTYEADSLAPLLWHGSRADAEALLQAFLQDPERRGGLVPVVAAHGDSAMASRLMDACADGDRLRDGFPGTVLHALGYLGFEPAERLLWTYARERTAEAADACLGLLHLPCYDLRDEIAEELEKICGSGLFNEMLPALATKTGDPSWLPRLIDWGRTYASVDCNAGLIVGIALHGPEARSDFLDLLWSPAWEAYDAGTGVAPFTYAGTRVLGLDMREIYAHMSSRSDGDPWPRFRTMITLLKMWICRPWPGIRAALPRRESAAELLDLLYHSYGPDDEDLSLLARAHRALPGELDLIAELTTLKAVLEATVRHERELRVFAARPTQSREAKRRG
ncbi:hypothetical protein [Streptomyces sp. NPDC059176]|uniref:hypothetical protein n=1 Tax=unclassified Streptomyces TaxID=2593676 RepID=UPI0036757588